MLIDLPTNYNEFIGVETIDKEFKEFTFNYSGILMDNKLAETYCRSNHFYFNKQVVSNLNKCIKYFLPKYVCAFFNSNITGHFIIGINDYGFTKGIPFNGLLPKKNIQNKMYEIVNTYVKYSDNFYNFSNNVKITFIKLNRPPKPNTTISQKFINYLNEKERNINDYKEYLQKLENWKIRFAFFNQKLVELVNNIESRLMLIDYIKKHDPYNTIIDLLYTDYKLEYKDHEQVTILKDDPNDTHYWLTRWKDEMIKIIKKDKPIFINNFNTQNTPLNLIIGVSDMIPHWINYNDNMNLYILHIMIIPPKLANEHNNNYSYYDLNTKKWLYCKRIVLENGEPICNPL